MGSFDQRSRAFASRPVRLLPGVKPPWIERSGVRFIPRASTPRLGTWRAHPVVRVPPRHYLPAAAWGKVQDARKAVAAGLLSARDPEPNRALSELSGFQNVRSLLMRQHGRQMRRNT